MRTAAARSAHGDDTPGGALAGFVDRLALQVGGAIYEERRRRGMTIQALAAKANVSVGTVHGIENGTRGSVEMYARLARALGRTLDMRIVDAVVRDQPRDTTDVVHAAMGEIEVGALRAHGLAAAVDEPWQHFHFAGRADVLAWHVEQDALLHIENKTRLPDVQDAVGRFNSTRQYLGRALWESLGFARRPRFETHAMIALWSAEVIRVLRQRPDTFRATFPDSPTAVLGWLAGEAAVERTTRAFLLIDPFASGRQRRYLGLDAALGTARPRVRGYAEAATRIRKAA